MKKVLIAVDYDPSAQLITEKGYELATKLGASVALLHVISDATYYSSLNYSPIMGFDSFSNLDIVQSDVIDSLQLGAEDYLNKTRQHLGDPSIETIVKDGDFGDTILETAEEIGAEIIVMGSHSRSGLDKLLMGSVAQGVLRKSTIPLFIIPTGKLDQKED